MFDVRTAVTIARALADETRLALLAALLDGAATVSDLGERLGLAPRVSSHLAVLRDAGLVGVAACGRQRVYRVDPARIGGLLAMLETLSPVPATPPRSAQAAREVRRNSAIRQARTCYDHLAGVAGIALLDDLLRRGWLMPDADDPTAYALTAEGTHALKALGVDVAAAESARRRFAFGCLDWTERRPHLGGALGAAILRELEAAGAVERGRDSRGATVRTAPEQWLETARS